MADQKIIDLSAATSPIAATALTYIGDPGTGLLTKATGAQIANDWVFNGTLIGNGIIDQATNTLDFNNAANGFTVRRTTGNTIMLLLDGTNGNYQIGDNAGQSLIFNSGGGGSLNYGGANFNIVGTVNATQITFDDTAKIITLTATNGVLIDVIKSNGNNMSITQATSGKTITITTLDDAITITSGSNLTFQSAGSTEITSSSFINLNPTTDIQLNGNVLPSTMSDIDLAFFTGGGKLTFAKGFLTVIG